MTHRIKLCAAVALLAGAVAAVSASGLIRLPFPGPAEPPLYTASIAPFIVNGDVFTVNDGQWAVISFARPISSIPADQDLLAFDFNAFGQPMTMRGFALFEEFPGPPTMSQARGDGAVPVWFMHVDELMGALADSALTLAELEALPSLKRGLASYYQEQNHYTNHRVSHLAAVASGTLEDGRTFRVNAVEVSLELMHVEIEFR